MQRVLIFEIVVTGNGTEGLRSCSMTNGHEISCLENKGGQPPPFQNSCTEENEARNHAKTVAQNEASRVSEVLEESSMGMSRGVRALFRTGTSKRTPCKDTLERLVDLPTALRTGSANSPAFNKPRGRLHLRPHRLSVNEPIRPFSTSPFTFPSRFPLFQLSSSPSTHLHRKMGLLAGDSRPLSSDSVGRGAFIVLEGLDRSGKSTQCTRILGFLEEKGLAVQSLRFPDRSTPIGQEINQYLSSTRDVDNETIHNLFSQNRWEKKDEMERALLSGRTLVVDRYAFSGVAYSAAKGMDFQRCKEPDSGLIAPDLVIFLDISPEAAAGRGDYGAERYEKVDFQGKVADQYARMRDGSWQVVDASQPLDAVTAAVLRHVAEVVDKCKSADALPLRSLWTAP